MIYISDMSIYRILDGNAVHVKDIDPSHYKDHLDGQSPKVTAVFCSDSREEFNDFVDRNPHLGEIFVIRNAGNVLDGAPAANLSVTYSAVHLGTKDILVIGHTGCGAVGAAFSDTSDEPWPIRDGISVLDNVVKITKRIIDIYESRSYEKSIGCEEILSSKSKDKYLALASEVNAAYQSAFYRKVLSSIGIDDVEVTGMVHDWHGIYGQEGALNITSNKVRYLSGSDLVVKHHPSRSLAEEMLGERYSEDYIDDLMTELSLSWNEKNPGFMEYIDKQKDRSVL